MFVLGLSGDIGAGKSTVASYFQSMGARVIDADKIVRSLWADGELADEALSRFGPSILDSDGKISKSKVAGRVFNDEMEYAWLCDRIHPAVRRKMTSDVDSGMGWIVAEIPLMFESGVPCWCDMTAYVTASLSSRIGRNGARKLTEAEIGRRERFLLPSDEKKAKADLVIENEGTLEELRQSLIPHGKKMLRMASICTVKMQCVFRRQAKRLISVILGKKLAYQANLMSIETAYARYDQFLMKNWEVEFYTLTGLVPLISQEGSEILKHYIAPLSVFDVRRASLPFREALCGACR